MTTMAINASYQQMNDEEENEEQDIIGGNPRDSGVIIHVIPENEKSRWNHIEDLDSFFTRVYHYHQKHGFTCMMLEEILELFQFVFIVSFSIFLGHGINYDILFEVHKNKTSISDAILPLWQWTATMGMLTWSAIFIASIVWLLRVVKVFYHSIQFRDIQSFYNLVLKIDDNDLDNFTWHEVQRKIIEVQKEQEMCIHKMELTELDIYHRILRFKNYFVAMTNKSLLPIKFQIPYFGESIFMSQGLKYNLELLLFWGPWSPFENNWHLREDFKKISKRHELARSLSKYIFWIGILNVLLSPLIFIWQILYSCFNYGELLKREPGTLGTRTWSLYGKLYLRHFNELDHELNARLNRAYRPASRYMSLFTSPLITVIAKTVAFISGSIFFVLVILTCYDGDFLGVEHVLMAMTATGTVAAVSRSLIPDENLIWCPESLLVAVQAHIHYRPDKWRNQAHTQTTRDEVSQLFQNRAVHLLQELISPLLTPYIFIFRLRYKALDIVDFYRHFTVEVSGVGDVCSFAQMDIKKHGNLLWQNTQSDNNAKPDKEQNVPNFENKEEEVLPPVLAQAEDGKTELSLIHFMLTNPAWKPPNHSEQFVVALQERAKREAMSLAGSEVNPFITSLNSLSSLGPQYNDIITNIIRSTIMSETSMPNINNSLDNINQQIQGPSSSHSFNQQPFSLESNVNKLESPKLIRRNASGIEGPPHISERGLLYGLQQTTGSCTQSLSASSLGTGAIDSISVASPELTAVDMSLSALYLHELHHRKLEKQKLHERGTKNVGFRSRIQELEVLPESGQEQDPLLLHQGTKDYTSISMRDN